MKTTHRLLCATALGALAGAAHAQDSDLLVFDYSGFEDPAFHAPYIEKHGKSPSFTFFGDEEEAFQKALSGFRTDVTHVCAGSVEKWKASGILEPWDKSRIPEFGNLNPTLLGTAVAEGEDAYFMPTDFGTTAISYNADEVDAEAVKTLQVFADPQFASRVAIPDNVDDAFALAFLATGVTDWTQATDEDIDRAADWLRSIHPNLRTYWTDPAEIAQMLATGEVLVAWTWNETVPTLAETGFPIGFERAPAEGSSIWLCGYVNMKDGPNSEDLAYDYINAFLDPSTSAVLVDSGYGHSNEAGMAQIGEEALKDVGLESIDTTLLAQLPMAIEKRTRMSELFERIKSGF